MQADAFEQGQRKEQPGLTPDDEPAQRAAAFGGLRGGERKHPVADVRIATLMIRVGVMTAVGVDPPALAQTDEHVAERAAERVVVPPTVEDCLMPGVVTQECHCANAKASTAALINWNHELTSRRSSRPAARTVVTSSPMSLRSSALVPARKSPPSTGG